MFLAGVRVLELADETGEYAGKVLAGLGAEVIKVEPPGGEVTRGYGPFLDDEPGVDRSLHFWHYNYGKHSVVLDLDTAGGCAHFADLAGTADVLLNTRHHSYLASRDLGEQALRRRNPALVTVHVSPFGADGPWADYAGSDLVHLALGGVMMNCGYDPDADGHYPQPPIAPQMWQAYHISGEITAMAILGALLERHRTGRGQHLETNVHQAVAQATEGDVPNWIFIRAEHRRVTCRHSSPTPDPRRTISRTKDGRWLLPYRTYLIPKVTTLNRSGEISDHDKIVGVLRAHDMAADLRPLAETDPQLAATDEFHEHVSEVVDDFVATRLFADDTWREFQQAGLTWAPLRRPEENLDDAHWQQRQTFLSVEHPELGRTFTEIGASWYCPDVPWRGNARAPLLGEHTAPFTSTERVPERPSESGPRDHPLAGIRHLDLGWLLASAGAGRFLAAMGAEVIKVEHESRADTMRWGHAIVPDPDPQRAARTFAGRAGSPNRCGTFMDINAGKRAISLNLKHPRGMELLRRLIRVSDVVTEGFSPGTLARLGLGYPALRELNPGLVYVQQSGFGQTGLYGRMRSYGPVAQAISGLSEMSGLPEPAPPAGIGYSYLDWFGAYNMAVAVLAGLHRRATTGAGCWIDSSQVETGTFLTGTAVLDYAANGRRWQRTGNRSPGKPAAPHGAYRTRGADRWIAIGCFTEQHWRSTVAVLGTPAWTQDPRFATLANRLAHQDQLDRAMQDETVAWDGYELMAALQADGVPAGVCQTARDRVEHDPALAHHGWLVDLPQSELGTWPAKDFPVRFESPVRIGGPLGRHGPNYAEDNDYVYRELLGLSDEEIADLGRDGVL